MCFAQSVITYNQRGFTDKSIVARLAQASAAIDRDTLGGLISSHPFVCELLNREDSPPKWTARVLNSQQREEKL